MEEEEKDQERRNYRFICSLVNDLNDEIEFYELNQLYKKAIEENNDITMLHYSGHSDKDGFNIDKDGNTVDISKEDIANLVKSCPNLRLVFFNSCYSEDFANEIFKINPNIPYVIGTKKAVNDYLASLVAFVFYRNLTIDSSRNIELAFNLTRAELEDNYDNGFENILSKISQTHLHFDFHN